MDSRCSSGLGIQLLNQSNYRVWRTRMESYLIGEDLCMLLMKIIQLFPQTSQKILIHSKNRSNWMQRWSLFWSDRFLTTCLITSYSANLPTKFGKLLIGSSTRRMEHDFSLENELANTIQGNLSISESLSKLCVKVYKPSFVDLFS